MPTHEEVARQCLMLIHNPSLNEPDYAAVENAIVRALDAASRRTVDVDAAEICAEMAREAEADELGEQDDETAIQLNAQVGALHEAERRIRAASTSERDKNE